MRLEIDEVLRKIHVRSCRDSSEIGNFCYEMVIVTVFLVDVNDDYTVTVQSPCSHCVYMV